MVHGWTEQDNVPNLNLQSGVENMKDFLTDQALPLIMNAANLIVFGIFLATHTLFLSVALVCLDFAGLKVSIDTLKEGPATASNIVSLLLCILAALGGIGLMVLWLLILLAPLR